VKTSQGLADNGGNPQVGRTSVENDVELLAGSADGDGTVVLGIEIVGDGNLGCDSLSDGGIVKNLSSLPRARSFSLLSTFCTGISI